MRQTISRWKKGLSVPDSGLLIRVAEVFETSGGTLLGDTVELSADKNIVAEKLEQLNTPLAERNRRSRRIWKAVAIAIAFIVVIIALIALSFTLLPAVRTQVSQNNFDAPLVAVKENVQIKESVKK